MKKRFPADRKIWAVSKQRPGLQNWTQGVIPSPSTPSCQQRIKSKNQGITSVLTISKYIILGREVQGNHLISPGYDKGVVMSRAFLRSLHSLLKQLIKSLHLGRGFLLLGH